jgi:tetratricopeptide (TPR) repeat protein
VSARAIGARVVATLACVAVLAPSAFAETPQPGGAEAKGWGAPSKPDPSLLNRPGLSEKNRKRYDAALEHLFEERYDEAKRELDKSYFRRMNEVEKAKFHMTYGQIAAGQGDRDEARRRFQAAIDTDGGLLPFESTDARFKIAQLWMQDEEWQEAVDTLEIWFRETPDPNASSYYILAICHYQLTEFAKALPAARKAVELGDPPQEGWIQLLLALHLLEKQYAEAAPLLEQLVSLYPKKDYFLSLSTVYGALGSFEDAAVPLQLAYEAGLIDEEPDLERLGQLLMFLNLPYRAGQLLEQSLAERKIEPDSEVLAMLSNSWIAAREYEAAIEPLEQAAEMSDDGELYVRLAQVHVQRENWDGATGALEKALAKGKLQQPGDAHLLMGIAFFSQRKPGEAQRWFESASGYEATRDEARTWLQHIAQELAVEQATTTGG